MQNLIGQKIQEKIFINNDILKFKKIRSIQCWLGK